MSGFISGWEWNKYAESLKNYKAVDLSNMSDKERKDFEEHCRLFGKDPDEVIKNWENMPKADREKILKAEEDAVHKLGEEQDRQNIITAIICLIIAAIIFIVLNSK